MMRMVTRAAGLGSAAEVEAEAEAQRYTITTDAGKLERLDGVVVAVVLTNDTLVQATRMVALRTDTH